MNLTDENRKEIRRGYANVKKEKSNGTKKGNYRYRCSVRQDKTSGGFDFVGLV